MKLFREDLPEQPLSRFRAKQLLLELALGELEETRKSQVEYWIAHCRETEADWQALNKALNWCEQVQLNLVNENQRPDLLPDQKKSSYKIVLYVIAAIALLAIGGGALYQFYDFDASNFQLLAKRERIRPHLEALQIEVVAAPDNHGVIEQLLNQFKKEGTEVKSIPGQKNHEKTWAFFVLQSHARELIDQIKTLGLVRIPEGDSAELVSDGQIQIILRSKSP